MTDNDYRTINVRESTKNRFKQAKEVAATDLGESPSQDQVVSELVEAYLGGDCAALRCENDG